MTDTAFLDELTLYSETTRASLATAVELPPDSELFLLMFEEVLEAYKDFVPEELPPNTVSKRQLISIHKCAFRLDALMDKDFYFSHELHEMLKAGDAIHAQRSTPELPSFWSFYEYLPIFISRLEHVIKMKTGSPGAPHKDDERKFDFSLARICLKYMSDHSVPPDYEDIEVIVRFVNIVRSSICLEKHQILTADEMSKNPNYFHSLLFEYLRRTFS